MRLAGRRASLYGLSFAPRLTCQAVKWSRWHWAPLTRQEGRNGAHPDSWSVPLYVGCSVALARQQAFAQHRNERSVSQE